MVMESLFVDRVHELDEFDSLLSDIARGRKRHIALLGLRRIGKTMLLAEARRRHPEFAIIYLALDETVSNPEDFARAFMAQILQVASLKRGLEPSLVQLDETLADVAEALNPKLVPLVKEILELAEAASYGALLVALMVFPSRLSEILNIPLLLMLDEFQEITRLHKFPGTDNRLGTIRTALDRPGRVGYAVAGSRVTALRNLLNESEKPLLTRFMPLEVGPFGAEATAELATRIWDDDSLSYDPDASVRLHRLSGGWPLYVQAVAQRARQMARVTSGKVKDEDIDIAFWHELFGRGATIAQHCRYLLETATSGDTESRQNTQLAVLKQVAQQQPITRTSLVRRLVRHHSYAEIHRAVNRLIENDFLVEQGSNLSLLDPVFALWLSAEPARQNPETLLANRKAMQGLLAWYEQRHAEDRQEMGALFEKRVENLVRQFSGQKVDGQLFGVDGRATLPIVREVGPARVDDPRAQYSDKPDTYEVDLVTEGNGQQERWAIECKHRKGAISVPMVQRFLKSVEVASKEKEITFSRLWMVAPKGIRADASALAKTEEMMVSGARQLDKMERLAASSWREIGKRQERRSGN